MKKIFSEIGFGNATFLSTEFEEGDSEYRVPRFVWPKVVRGVYIRIWIVKTVFILSTDRGFSVRKKERNAFKVLFGVSGEE